ncbi:uncharacterized protein LOC113301960 isoform X1 [Papaver somniferum]|uniref:uncharacterized protein LOC113301960 isoform X1 n=1 Tax=Papaver somniferum TaxID=3469 RepID=UPI000E6F767F|nr:uncharacterized protein LOC113301960 isoform X1 [Papaver somniferum]
MGSSSSKNVVGSSSSFPSSTNGRRKNQLIATTVSKCSCLGGLSSGSYETDASEDEVSNERNKASRRLSGETLSVEQNRAESIQVKRGKVKVLEDSSEVPSISIESELDDEWGQVNDVARTSSVASIADGSSSQVASSRSRSRFSFFPGNISFRLSRAASLGSSRAYSLFPNGFTGSNAEEGFPVHTDSTISSINRNEVHQETQLLPECSISRLPAAQVDSVLQVDSLVPRLPVHLQDVEIISARDMARNNENTGSGVSGNLLRNITDVESMESRRPDRRIRSREPVERSVRFSRTLSVGRLRDRVLRRSSFSDALFGRLQEDRVVRDSSQDNGAQAWAGITRPLDSNGTAEQTQASSSYPPSELNSIYNSQGYDVDASRTREARYHEIMERRTDFLERRRRIRSQVRALQRLGSRFENLSGHERSCILSGQHRTGLCTCRTINRTNTNPDDDTSARASISRIVMLAEALFEVLDEIHQQSVVLSSRPSVSSIGSVPAPKEVVESMPVKIYAKSQKQQNDDAAQCYICLVEYEEGDCMRILPCHHEFHQTCVDKWLKEIHRVCPLCRGDVCRSESFAVDN